MEHASHTKKILSTFFAFVLAVTLVPSAALATDVETATDNTEQEQATSNTEETENSEASEEEADTDDSTSDTTGSTTTNTTTDTTSLLDTSALTTSSTDADAEISLASTNTKPDTSSWTSVTSEATLKTMVDEAGEVSYARLDSDVYLSAQLELEESSSSTTWGATLNLDLNGHKLYRSISGTSGSGSVIWMHTDSVLNLYDTSDTQTGQITGGSQWNSGGGVYAGEGTRLTIYGGSITGNTATGGTLAHGGGGVYVDSGGYLTMYGGSISNNTLTGTGGGGGVFLDEDSRLYMHGGSISNNKQTDTTDDSHGGGVNAYSAMIFMYGGTISGNSSQIGAGIALRSSNSSLTMTGGTITNNTTDIGIEGVSAGEGGGVYVAAYASNSVFISGSAEISNNYASDGGGICFAGEGTFTMSGGTITGNKTASGGYGGGIYISSSISGSAPGTISGGVISNNTAGQGGGIFTPTITIGAATISGNTSSEYGGGVCATTLTMDGATVTGNSSETFGGGICSTYLTISNSTISNNSAGIYGGGLGNNLYGSSSTGGTITNCTFTGNTAASAGSGIGHGGTLAFYGDLTVTGNTCSNPTSDYPGGAFCVSYADFNVNSGDTVTISGNTGGDFVRNTTSEDTTDETCADFNGYSDTANVDIALTLSPGQTYQKIINLADTNQYKWFSLTDSSNTYLSVQSEYWVWVFNKNQVGTGVAIDSITLSNAGGTKSVTVPGSQFDNGNLWTAAGIFTDDERTTYGLTVTTTYTVTTYDGKGGKTSNTYTTNPSYYNRFTDSTVLLIDYPSTYKATYTNSETTFVAHNVARISVAAYDSSTVSTPEGLGGSLRMDTAATTTEGVTTYHTDDTSLRFGYNYQLPSGLSMDDVTFGWNYSTSTNGSGALSGTIHTLEGSKYRTAGSLSTDKAGLTGYIANIVFKDVSLAYYSNTIYAQMYVTYTLNGATVTEYTDVRSNSVQNVYTSILNDSSASTAEEAYAKALRKAHVGY